MVDLKQSGRAGADERQTGTALKVVIAAVMLGFCGWAVWFYFGRVLSAPDAAGYVGPYNPTAQLWGVRGDAMGPFAALFNAGALIAALGALWLCLATNRNQLLNRQIIFDKVGLRPTFLLT